MRGIWLARDSNEMLYAYDKKPIGREKNMHDPIFVCQKDGHCMYIGAHSHYQIVTHENSPIFIPLTKKFLEQCLDRSKTH